MYKIEMVRLKLSLQRALLGNVSPKLRAICANAEENKIYVNFYYDGEISEEDMELYNSILDNIFSDFLLPEQEKEKETEFYMPAIRLDYPTKMPLIGHWVYYRYEPHTPSPRQNAEGQC